MVWSDASLGANEGVHWGALLLQAKANCAHAEANLQQAKANEETSHGVFMSTQGSFGEKGTIDLESDRLESWYAARDDGANGVSIAASITRQAQDIIAM